MQPFAELRRDYHHDSLTEEEAGMDPFALFHRWFAKTLELGIPDPNAMTLATVSNDGHPSARIVLLKGLDERGFTFFTNYESQKGHELANNPHGAIVFFWHDLARQVRAEGIVERVSAQESDEYFVNRPLGSRLGAWASPQSQVIADREFLEQQHRELSEKFPDGNVPRPPHWGGYRLIPQSIEFWQGRLNRLHDRLRYVRASGEWKRERLAP